MILRRSHHRLDYWQAGSSKCAFDDRRLLRDGAFLPPEHAQQKRLAD
jgi:hypothetical protein